MGRIFETLKQAEATHFSSAASIAGPVLNLADQAEVDSSGLPEIAPYVEVGGRTIEGSPDVLSVASPRLSPRGRSAGYAEGGEAGPRESGAARAAAWALHRIPLPQASQLRDAHPVSVAFQPLDRISSQHGKAGQVAPEIIAFHQPDHPVSKEYETLAEAIEAQLPMGGSHVLMFMGASSGGGTTTVVLNLAFTWARTEQKRIVVVDAGAVNLSRGTVAQKIGLPASLGLAEVLADKASLPSTLQQAKSSKNLFVLPSGSDREGDTGLPARPMRDLLRQLRKQFDLILIDAPPWNPEIAPLASGCDAVYLVVLQSTMKTTETDELIKLIQGQQIPLGGCVLTKSVISNQGG
jgi:Mrp family chromosome partitioning ATPase